MEKIDVDYSIALIPLRVTRRACPQPVTQGTVAVRNLPKRIDAFREQGSDGVTGYSHLPSTRETEKHFTGCQKTPTPINQIRLCLSNDELALAGVGL